MLVSDAVADNEPSIEGFGHVAVAQQGEERLAAMVSVYGVSQRIVGAQDTTLKY